MSSSSVASWIFQPDRLNFPLQALPVSGLDGEDVVIPVAGKGQVRGWLLLPKDVESSDDGDERTVGCWSDVAVLYLHGVSGNRGKFKRVESYRRLLDIGCTVLAIDYRYCTLISVNMQRPLMKSVAQLRKKRSCVLWEFFPVLVLLKSFKFGSLLMS